MNKFITKSIITLLIVVFSAVLLTNAFGEEKTGKMDGKALFEQKCLKCHKNTKFKDLASDRKGWVLTLSRMQRSTCALTDEELDVLADYLSKVYGE